MEDVNTAAIGSCRVAAFSIRKVWLAANRKLFSQLIVVAQRFFR